MKVFPVLLFLFISSLLYSQEEILPVPWVNGGVGLNSLTLGLNANANMALDNFLLTIKYSANGALTGDSFNEFGLLAGYIIKKTGSRISISGGFSQGTYTRSLGGMFTPNEKKSYAGFIAELQYCKPIWDFLGYGFVAYGNINKERNMLGVNFNLFIGNIKLD